MSYRPPPIPLSLTSMSMSGISTTAPPHPPPPPPTHPSFHTGSLLSSSFSSSPLSTTATTTASATSTTTRTETRTLLTFPTEGLPSPRILSQANLRAFPVRHNATSGVAPAQTQVNRWLCCRCAEEGYLDPVGMVHTQGHTQARAHGVVGGYGAEGRTSGGGGGGDRSDGVGRGSGGGVVAGEEGGGDGRREAGGGRGAEEERTNYDTCWRPTCRHRKCVNCALFAGPLGRDPKAKLLIRTVGGLHASPRFVDPVYWECAGCGEWVRNRFDSRCTLGVTGCWNEGCVFAWRAGRAQLGLGMGVQVGFGSMAGVGQLGRDGGAGVLTADSVVMNRYGQRLGTADQRVAVADGPWDWQRRALGDPRCAVVAGLRAAMKRTGEGMRFDGGQGDSGRRRSLSDSARLWREGEPVPHFPYRRPPPVDENDAEENNEYEGSYLAGMPTEPLDKGKGAEHQYSSLSPRTCSASSPVSNTTAVGPGSLGSGSGFFSGWNHLQR